MRSPTAEALFKNYAFHRARSAGTSDKARIKVNTKLLTWADVVFDEMEAPTIIIAEFYNLATVIRCYRYSNKTW